MKYKEATEAELCKEAILVQNACNIGGVTYSYHDLICRVRELKGWDYPLYRHPAVFLFRDKIDDLMGTPLSMRDFDRYSMMYNQCRDIAGLKDNELRY